ncbi:MAG TPA: hypothetical protein VG270_01985 [Pseudolabrys sp.]|nr:hypothetical protein [Pseudolabrys sp.]
MHFALRKQGPAQICGTTCKTYVVASGAITADTPAEFLAFAKNLQLNGALVVLESEGGSVHGAVKLGRQIRKLGLDTTIGHITDLKPVGSAPPRGIYDPHADCESMCSFVLLAGIHRSVPPQARLMVHQIWLGDRREDPTSAIYSAEDLVLVQRDLGKLAVYTAEMGGSMAMYDLALRIPPWEPMHVMTRREIAEMGVETQPASEKPTSANVASALPTEPAVPLQPATLTNGAADISKISERDWAMVAQSGATSLARRHPLTVEGDDIGTFDLHVSCTSGGSYNAVYIEHRHAGDDVPLAHALRTIRLRAAGHEATLKVVASDRHDPDELVTYATGTISAAMIDGFGGQGDHSMFIETRSKRLFTSIRIGNTGVAANLPRLAATCAMPSVQQKRAALVQPAPGAVASAQ